MSQKFLKQFKQFTTEHPVGQTENQRGIQKIPEDK